MAKKRSGNVLERALRGARGVLKDYVRPGARTAESKIDELLVALGEARKELSRQSRRLAGGGKSTRRKKVKRNAARRAPARRRKSARRKIGRKTRR